MIPEDQAICVHNWIDTYGVNGLSRETPDKQIIWFFCKKCLEMKKKIIDVSDQLINPETLALYEDEEKPW